MFELPRSEFQDVNEGFLQRIHPLDRERVHAACLAALSGQGRFDLEHRIVLPNGTVKFVRATGDLKRDAAGQPITMTGAVLDITDRKHIEAERESLYQQVLASREELRVLSRRLLESQEEERRRLAGELHDEIGQVLTTVHLNLEALRARVEPAALALVDEGMQVVNRAIEQVRGISLDLRPAALDLLGLETALRAYLKRQTARIGLRATLDCALGGERLPAPWRSSASGSCKRR